MVNLILYSYSTWCGRVLVVNQGPGASHCFDVLVLNTEDGDA